MSKNLIRTGVLVLALAAALLVSVLLLRPGPRLRSRQCRRKRRSHAGGFASGAQAGRCSIPVKVIGCRI